MSTDRQKRALPDRDELARVIRFGLVGAASFAAYSAAMLLVVRLFQGGQVLGALAGFICGTVVSYFGNALFVFKVSPGRRNAIKFWVVTLIGLGLNLTLAFILESRGVPPLVTSLVIFCIVPVFNYLAHRAWTFQGMAAPSTPRRLGPESGS